MTPQEFKERRLNILEAMLLELSPSEVMIQTESEEWLDKLERLDKEYAAAKSSPFYHFINQIDTDVRNLVGSQGDEIAQIKTIDVMVSHLIKRGEDLRKKTESDIIE